MMLDDANEKLTKAVKENDGKIPSEQVKLGMTMWEVVIDSIRLSLCGTGSLRRSLKFYSI